MSENHLRVEALFEAWNRQDLDGMLSGIHHDIDIHLTGMFSGLGPNLHGHEGFRRVWDELQGTWQRLLIEVDEIRGEGDLVFAATQFFAMGRDGISAERPFYFVFGYRQDKCSWYRSFADRAPALEAAGLSE
jgi:ketosteroid isomerase-like protein